MQDRILEGYIKDFSSQYGLEKLSPSSLFSYFVNYCVISRQTAAALSLDDFDVDGGQDLGIDAIAVLINGRAVNAKEAVDHFRDKLGRPNRQTEVKVEAFESLAPFHRKLEEFYASFGKANEKRLYYERRSRQYDSTEIKPKDIISLAAQAPKGSEYQISRK